MRTRKIWTLETLKARCDVDETTGCWIWLGGLRGEGYGEVCHNGKILGAHRLALELDGRPVPPGLVAMHACDRRRCINPAHLSIGTYLDNALDCINKGRSSRPLKITPEALREARRLREQGLTQQQIADRLGTTQATVSRHLNGVAAIARNGRAA